MANDYFMFREFTIQQDKCAMKVGTDGVLLGAWVNTDGTNKILDIGTGTGLVALMLAQRSNAKIDAIEVDDEATVQATDNCRKSKWSDRLTVVGNSIQEFSQNNNIYDLIVSNPPYFSNTLPSAMYQRTLARHDVQLTIPELVEGVTKLLAITGRFALIYPAHNFHEVLNYTGQKGLMLIRKTYVIPTPGKRAHRILAEFSFNAQYVEESELIIEKYGRHKYSEEYHQLTKAFYL